MSGVWRFLRLLKQRVIGPGSEYVGIDHFGNKYYRIPQHNTWADKPELARFTQHTQLYPINNGLSQSMNYR